MHGCDILYTCRATWHVLCLWMLCIEIVDEQYLKENPTGMGFNPYV